MNWYQKLKDFQKTSGKTYRDDKSTIMLYHASPERLSSLKPLSKFENYTGMYMSPSYRSIILDWMPYIIGKKRSGSKRSEDKGYKNIYLHQIICPKYIYDRCVDLYYQVRDSGYKKESFGFWNWGNQVFVPEKYLWKLHILSVKQLSQTDFLKSYDSIGKNRNKPSFNKTPEQEEKFEMEEEKIRQKKEEKNELV